MDLHSDYPFWMIKDGIISSFPSLRDNWQTDVLIIGGGITGALIAHRLAATNLKVTGHVAHGNTSASTSMLQYEIDVPLYGGNGIVFSVVAADIICDEIQVRISPSLGSQGEYPIST